MAQTVKHLPALRETRVRFLGREDPLEKEMAIHSSTLAWKIPWTRSLIGYSPWGREESDTTERLHFHFHFIYTYIYIFLKIVLKPSGRDFTVPPNVVLGLSWAIDPTS